MRLLILFYLFISNWNSEEMYFRWCNVEVRKGGYQISRYPRHLNAVQKYEAHPQRALISKWCGKIARENTKMHRLSIKHDKIIFTFFNTKYLYIKFCNRQKKLELQILTNLNVRPTCVRKAHFLPFTPNLYSFMEFWTKSGEGNPSVNQWWYKFNYLKTKSAGKMKISARFHHQNYRIE